jgi:hypothetical protein
MDKSACTNLASEGDVEAIENAIVVKRKKPGDEPWRQAGNPVFEHISNIHLHCSPEPFRSLAGLRLLRIGRSSFARLAVCAYRAHRSIAARQQPRQKYGPTGRTVIDAPGAVFITDALQLPCFFVLGVRSSACCSYP